MALPHAQPGQVVEVGPFGDGLRDAKTIALFKSRDLEVMRIVLPAGKALPPHRVNGEITVQCIEGEITVGVDGATHAMRAGQLLYVTGGVTHDLKATSHASVLVTVALRDA